MEEAHLQRGRGVRDKGGGSGVEEGIVGSGVKVEWEGVAVMAGQ